MALNTILEEQTCTGFFDVTGGAGLYIYTIDGTLIDGETYQIKWDGVEYVCTAFPGDEVTGVGNKTIDGSGEDTGEPFLIASDDEGLILATLDSAESHTVGIYQVVASDEPEEPVEPEEPEENIILKDRNGDDIEYQGIDRIRLRTASGGVKEFVNVKTAEKTVDPDFSNGDIEITADDGTLMTKVTVEKPDELLPENIRKGMEIAGVTGDFIGDTEEVTVGLALADGNQTISPSVDGKVLSKVTITKPETLTPDNIVKDVDIGGVVGTVEIPESVGKSIDLDFSSGDMVVTPESGKAFNQVSIPQPENLIPDNIAEGVDIAGIIGTLAAGGGGGAVKIAGGSLTGGSSVKTITHNLGVNPDIFLLWVNMGMSASTSKSYVWCYMSDVLKQASKFEYNSFYANTSSAGKFGMSNGTFSCTSTTITASSVNSLASTKYYWIAIGGLT